MKENEPFELSVIHKHQLKSRTENLILPLNFEFLHFGEQNGQFYIWEKHSIETKSTCKRTFHVIYTGEAFACNETFKYLGTIVQQQAIVPVPLVYHLFMEDI
jgi:hypothetical protein